MKTKNSIVYVCCDLEEPVLFPYIKKNVLFEDFY